jgi:basic membrane protein A
MTKDGNFPSGNYFGEVGLAPYHDFDSSVSADIKAKIEEIDAGLKDGSISTGYNPGG